MTTLLDPGRKTQVLEVLFGKSTDLPTSWTKQAFMFHDDSSDATFFALVQDEGGPCGVLAAIQAHILRALLTNRETMESFDDRAEMRRFAFSKALASILWKAKRNSPPAAQAKNVPKPSGKQQPQPQAHAQGQAHAQAQEQAQPPKPPRDKNTAGVEDPSGSVFLILVNENHIWNILELKTMEETIEAIKAHEAQILRAGVVPFTCSVILTKGLEAVKNESSIFPGEIVPLTSITSADCNQELVNLFLTGRAVGHPFDGTMDQGGIVLKGITERSEIGFLTEAEALGLILVGSNYKNPLDPLWVIHADNHYSVLYSAADDGQNSADSRNDYYWFPGGRSCRYLKLKMLLQDTGGGIDASTMSIELDRLLKCIRTRWTSAKLIDIKEFSIRTAVEDDGYTSSGSEK